MNRLVRALMVVTILLGQIAGSAQAVALADCHEPPTSRDSAAQQDTVHAHHGEMSHHRQAEPEAPAERSVDTAADCHCAGSFHCGQMAGLVTEVAPVSRTADDDSLFPRSPFLQPALAHRRELDRPPA